MDNIFQPEVAVANSAVTPQAGVVDKASVDLFSTVASTAAKAGFSAVGRAGLDKLKDGLGQVQEDRGVELNNLRKNLSNISQVMESSSKDTTSLRVKARALLDKTKADVPWMADQADDLYKAMIGSNSGSNGAPTGGIFAPSVEEQALAAFDKEVVDLVVATGMTKPNATERVKMNKAREAQKKEFDFLLTQGKVEGNIVNNYVNSTLAVGTVRYMDLITQERAKNKGSLGVEQVNNINNMIDRQAADLFSTALKGLKGADGEALTNPPTTEAINEIQSDINDWVTKSKKLTQDSSTTKLISDLNLQSTAREQQIIHENYGAIDIANAKGGQAYVQNYIEFAGVEQGTIQDWFKRQNPELMSLLGRNADVPRLLNRGYNELIQAEPPKASIMPLTNEGIPSSIVRKGMTEEEAIVTSTALIDESAPASLMWTVYDRVFEDARSEGAYKAMLNKNNDSFKQFFGERFNNYLISNEKAALKVTDVAVQAARETFNTLSFANSGSFTPPDFEIVRKATTAGGLIGHPKVTARGSGLTSETVGVINNLYRLFESNKKVLDNFITKNGLPTETTAEEATSIALLGKGRSVQQPLPDKSFDATSKRLDKAAVKEFKESLSPEDFQELFGEATEKQSKGTKSTSGTNTKGASLSEVGSSEMALKLQPFIEAGYTEERVLETLSALGFADNAHEELMRKQIKEVFNGKS